MRWTDQGILLATRQLGEDKLIVSLLTLEHGRHLGVVRVGSKTRQQLHAGGIYAVQWQARLPEHMGSWQLESLINPLGAAFNDPLRLEALNSCLWFAEKLLPERTPHATLFRVLHRFITFLSEENWMWEMIAFEQTLLQEGGISLDFSHCAVTGRTENLAFLSPRTGRAVSYDAGQPFVDRLLPLPEALRNPALKHLPLEKTPFAEILNVFSHFFSRFLLEPQGLEMPESRERLMMRLTRPKKIAA